MNRPAVLRAGPGAVTVAGHLLELAVPGAGCCLRWELRCAGCLDLLSSGTWSLAEPGLAGRAEHLPALAGAPAITWAIGLGQGDAPVAVVADRGPRRPCRGTALRLPGLPRAWVTAWPGRARDVIALQGGSSLRLPVERRARQVCRA